MPGLDQYAGYVVAAFGITWLSLAGYWMYLRSRLRGLRRTMDTEPRVTPAER